MKLMSEKHLSNIALTLKEKEVSYQHLIESIYKLHQDIPANIQRIAVCSENRFEWIYTLYAAWAQRALFIPIDFMSTDEEIRYILDDAEIDMIFYSNETKSKVLTALSKSKKPNIKKTNFDEIKSLEHRLTDEEIQEEIDHFWTLSEKERERTALVIYTSGTTGGPKGVMLSFNNLKSNIDAITEHVDIFTEQDTTLALLPFHHIFPIVGTIIGPIYVGAKIAFSPSLSADDMLETLQTKKVTIFIGVPRLYRLLYNGMKKKIESSLIAKIMYRLANKVDSYSFSRKLFNSVHEKFGGQIKVMVTGGAATDPEIMEFFKTLGFDILEGYGMTETAPMIAFTRPKRLHLGAAGEITPGMEVKIVDGEIVVKGRNVMQGYLNKPKETAEVLKDGWLHTGDLGRVDEENRVFVTGRKKDIIVLSSGKNVNPDELEFKILKTNEYIEETAVFLNKEQLWALIKPNVFLMKKNHVFHMESLFQETLDKVNSEGAPYKRIAGFQLISEEIPRTRLGKVKRFQLPKLIEKVQDKGDVKTQTENIEVFEELTIIQKYLEEETSQKVNYNDHLEIDLSLDSLAKVNLEAFILSTFGVKASMDTFFQYSTVIDLANHVRDNKEKIEVKKINWKEIFKEDFKAKLPKSSFIHDLLTMFFKLFFKIYFRVTIEGKERLKDYQNRGPLIFVANHQSYFDGAFLMTSLKYKTLKNTFFYAKEKHVKKGIIRFLANRSNVITIDMNKDLLVSLKKLAYVLKSGKNVVIFPEGTRSKTGDLGDFKRSFAILGQELQVPIVPIAIDGAYQALKTGSKCPTPFTKVKVKFLPEIDSASFSDHNQLKDSVRETIKNGLS